jgi:signal peptidase II
MAIKYHNVHWLWLSLAVLALDQISKQLVFMNLQPYEALRLLPVLNLTHMRNTGAAFSMLSSAPPLFFIALGIVVSIGILWWLRRHPRGETLVAVGLSLIQGGALGNIIDRAYRGHVVDFIDFHIGECGFCHWPAFNVADSAIVIGAGLLILDLYRKTDAEKVSARRRS